MEWTHEVNPDRPETTHWTSKVGGLTLHVWHSVDPSDWNVTDADGHIIALGKARGEQSIMDCMACAKAVARIEVGDE